VEASRWKMEASRGLPASSVNDNDSDNDTNEQTTVITATTTADIRCPACSSFR
jgi:hypothetical protein